MKHSNANSGPAIAQNSSAAILVRTKGNGHTSTMLIRHCAYNVGMDSTIALLAALAEPTRLAATRILWDGSEHCVCELMAKLGASQSRMSRHMSVLKAAGLVTDRRDAQWVRYRRNPALSPAFNAIVEAVLTTLPETERKAA